MDKLGTKLGSALCAIGWHDWKREWLWPGPERQKPGDPTFVRCQRPDCGEIRDELEDWEKPVENHQTR